MKRLGLMLGGGIVAVMLLVLLIRGTKAEPISEVTCTVTFIDTGSVHEFSIDPHYPARDMAAIVRVLADKLRPVRTASQTHYVSFATVSIRVHGKLLSIDEKFQQSHPEANVTSTETITFPTHHFVQFGPESFGWGDLPESGEPFATYGSAFSIEEAVSRLLAASFARGQLISESLVHDQPLPAHIARNRHESELSEWWVEAIKRELN